MSPIRRIGWAIWALAAGLLTFFGVETARAQSQGIGPSISYAGASVTVSQTSATTYSVTLTGAAVSSGPQNGTFFIMPSEAPPATGGTILYAGNGTGGHNITQTGTFSGPTWVRIAVIGAADGINQNGYWKHYQLGAAAYQFTIPTITNTSGVPVEYQVTQNGAPIPGFNTVTIPAGGSLAGATYTGGDGSPVTVTYRVPSLAGDGSSWVAVTPSSNSGTSGTAGTVTPTNTGTIPTVTLTGPVIPTTTIQPGNEKTIWVTPTAGTNALDTGTYREGVDKVVAAVKAGGGGGGTTTVDLSPITSRQDTAATTLTANRKTDSEAAEKKEKTATDNATKATSDSATAGATAGTAAAASFSALGAPSTVAYAAGSTAALTVAFPAAFGGATIDFNPFRSDRLGPVMAWFKTAVEWLAYILLGVWIWQQLAPWIRGVSGVQQAKGNPVVAGTGAQATALVCAGLMTIAIVAAVVGLLSWSFGSVSLSFIRSKMAESPLGGMAAGSLWMLNQALPVGTLIGCLIARASFNMFAAPVFATCSAICRFIVA